MKGKITGKVIDAENRGPLEFATVTVFQQADSTLVTGGITNIDGIFEVEVRPGQYLVKVEFISYRPQWIAEIQISRESSLFDVGVVTLNTDATTLQEVEVRAEKSQLQMALDKKIFNVGKDLASTSGSASEILDNIPSVTVDVEGNVSLRGSDNVRVLVDGKPSGLVGVRGSGGLNSLPANMIDRVEIVTNPSARYEAEGMSGIINIILKKDRRKGLNGSFDVTAGYPETYGAAINMNLRRKNINLFANYGINTRTSPVTNFQYQEFYSNDTTRIVDQTQGREWNRWSNNIRLGADYFLNDNNTLTGSLIYRISKGNNRTDIQYDDFLRIGSNNAFPTGISRRSEDEDSDEPTLEYSLNYKRTFDEEKRELTASVQYRKSTEAEDADYLESFFQADDSPTGQPTLQQRSYNNETESSLVFQVDYVHPVGENGKFETGYRGSIRGIDNDYLVEQFEDDAWATLTNLSNDFNYEENIHALYAILGNKMGRFSYQFGLRWEYSDVLTELLQTNEVNHRDYNNLFPSTHFTYELPGNNTLQVSYTRRLRRPRFWYLNPFFTFADSRNIFRGNPNLDPEFTDSYELGHIKYWKKASLTSSIYYRHSTGVMERVQTLQEMEGQLVTVRQPENLATEDSYGLEFIISADPYKWWNINGSLNFFRSVIDGSNVDASLARDAISWFGRVNSRLTLWKSIDIQTRLYYRAPQETTQGKRKSVTSMDLGVSREVFNKNGTLTLSVRDVFNAQKWRFETYADNFFSVGEHRRRPRQLTLTLNYRLNQQNGKKGRRGDRGEGGFGGDDDMEF